MVSHIIIPMKTPLPRMYDEIVRSHLEKNRQMAFIAGPRQVGKTTVAKSLGTAYVNWDNDEDRRLVLAGLSSLKNYIRSKPHGKGQPIAVLDELHKYPRWKTFIKGFYDAYNDQIKVVLTGSSRLDVYRRGGDSLMGRYFLYHMHPFSVGELLRPVKPEQEIAPPARLNEEAFTMLWLHGGFPDPMLRNDEQYSRQWHQMRRKQLLQEDIRDLSGIKQLAQLETLEAILSERSGEQLIYANLARDVAVSESTARHWVETLSALHHGFLVRPWFKNISKALRKEPKWFLRDWSGIKDPGNKAETFVACHLLKAVETWTDLGMGVFELKYVRDQQKREVDFIVIKNNEPWFLVEVKRSDERLSKHLRYFADTTHAPHAFQVVVEADYLEVDCFEQTEPCVVSARTFLSQLP